MPTNREIAVRLVDSLVVAISADEASKMLIFGSAAVALQGVDLGRAINDLDIFVSEAIFERLALRFGVEERAAPEGGTIFFIRPVKDVEIEILKTIPGLTFEPVFSRAFPLDGTRGLKVGSLADLQMWKRTQGRPKDLADIDAIDRFMNEAEEDG